jgi:hypothetical protein
MLQQLGLTTLRGRGGRARALREARFTDLGNGWSNPFQPPSHRPSTPILGWRIVGFLAAEQYFLDHLRLDFSSAQARRAHLQRAPAWMQEDYRNAAADLDVPEARWPQVRNRRMWALVAAHLGIEDVRTVKRVISAWSKRVKDAK